MDLETVTHGLQITVVGMLLVFFALGMVILSMVLLTKLPWLRAKEEKKDKPEEQPAAAAPIPQDDELAQVAAIAVAMLRSTPQKSSTRSTPGRPTIRPTGSLWKSSGRAQQVGF